MPDQDGGAMPSWTRASWRSRGSRVCPSALVFPLARSTTALVLQTWNMGGSSPVISSMACSMALATVSVSMSSKSWALRLQMLSWGSRDGGRSSPPLPLHCWLVVGVCILPMRSRSSRICAFTSWIVPSSPSMTSSFFADSSAARSASFSMCPNIFSKACPPPASVGVHSTSGFRLLTRDYAL